MKVHDLKIHPSPFYAVKSGDKTFEFRRDDRGFEVGDKLLLREWDPKVARSDFHEGPIGYTGFEIWRRVTYIARGPDFGIPDGFVVMSIVVILPDNNYLQARTRAGDHK